MIPGITPETAEKTGVLQIGGIRSSDGQRAYTGSMATFASFIYVYPLQTLAYTFAADYVPAKGSSVKGGSPVEIWIMNGAHLVHEGLEISYAKDGQSMKKVLSAEELKITTDPDDSDAMLINFDMPQIDADDMSEISCGPTMPPMATDSTMITTSWAAMYGIPVPRLTRSPPTPTRQATYSPPPAYASCARPTGRRSAICPPEYTCTTDARSS